MNAKNYGSLCAIRERWQRAKYALQGSVAVFENLRRNHCGEEEALREVATRGRQAPVLVQ